MENQSSMNLKKHEKEILSILSRYFYLKALGFVPKYTVETGLKDYFNFEVDNIEEVTAKEVEMS